MTDALHEVFEDSLPWLRDGSPQHEPNEVVQFDQIQDGDPREGSPLEESTQDTFDLEVGLKI